MNAPIVTGLEKYQTAFDGAASDLRDDQNRCKRDQTERDYARLSVMVERIGMANVTALLAQVAEETAMEHPETPDWLTAHRALEVAAAAVDLPYAEADAGPCDADKEASRAAIKAGRGTRGDYERMRGFG